MEYQLNYINTDKNFDVKHINEITIITWNDKLNIYNVPFFSKTIDILISQNKSSILINMKNLYYIDSSGLGVLFATMNRLKKNNINFKLIGPTEYIKKIFIRSDIESLFEVYDDEEDAIKSLEN